MLLIPLTESNFRPASYQMWNNWTTEQLVSELDFKFSLNQRGPNAERRHDFGTYDQYSYPICSQSEVISDVSSGVAVEEVALGVPVQFCDSIGQHPFLKYATRSLRNGQRQRTTTV